MNARGLCRYLKTRYLVLLMRWPLCPRVLLEDPARKSRLSPPRFDAPVGMFASKQGMRALAGSYRLLHPHHDQ